MSALQLIVGLGNPGPKYELTRHNAGFRFVDALARRHGGSFRHESRFHGEVARCAIEGKDLRLHKPMTFMNLSGQAVSSVINFYRIPLDAVLVVHDELDLPPGTVRLKRGGGHGGHNGLRDLARHLSDTNYLRLRIGIGHPGHRDQVVDYVLKRAPKDDQQAIDAAIDAALEVIPLAAADELERAMHQLHSKA